MSVQLQPKELITRWGIKALIKRLPSLESFKSADIYKRDVFQADHINGAVYHNQIPSSTSAIVGSYAIVKKIDQEPEITVCWVSDFTKAASGKSKFYSANIRGITEFRALKKAYPELMSNYELDM